MACVERAAFDIVAPVSPERERSARVRMPAAQWPPRSARRGAGGTADRFMRSAFHANDQALLQRIPASVSLVTCM